MRTISLCGVLLTLLNFVFSCPCPAVEVVVNGTSYESLEAYKASKNPVKKVRARARHPLEARTLDLAGAAPISKATAKKWETIGYEHSFKRMAVDFQQNWDKPTPKFRVSSDELEGRLKALLAGRTEPLLVISGANKLRIMRLEKKKEKAAE